MNLDQLLNSAFGTLVSYEAPRGIDQAWRIYNAARSAVPRGGGHRVVPHAQPASFPRTLRSKALGIGNPSSGGGGARGDQHEWALIQRRDTSARDRLRGLQVRRPFLRFFRGLPSSRVSCAGWSVTRLVSLSRAASRSRGSAQALACLASGARGFTRAARRVPRGWVPEAPGAGSRRPPRASAPPRRPRRTSAREASGRRGSPGRA